MMEIMIFEGHEVEVFEFKGKILFNPKDVAKCLDIVDANSTIRNFSDKQVVKLKNSDMQEVHIRKLNNAGENFLTESGVYKMIFKSKKPNAEDFQDWVVDEVLPRIRQTGGYVQENREEEFVEKYFPSFSDEVKLGMVQDLMKKNKELKEKAEYTNNVLDSDKLVNISVIAKDFGLSAIALNKKLNELGVQYKQGEQWLLYAKYSDKGYTQSKTTLKIVDGEAKTYIHTKWTELGRKFIHDTLRKEGILTTVEKFDNLNGFGNQAMIESPF